MRRVLAALAAAVVLAGCTSTAEVPVDEPAPASPEPTPTGTTTPPDPGPTPALGECHALTFRQALAVVGRTAPVPCRKRHTAQTYFVGTLDLTTDAGFTRRVDSQAAQRQMRTACTRRLPRHLGRTPRELRLSMVRAVWFTPSPARAEAGADWFRCDVVAVASPRELLRLPRRTRSLCPLPTTRSTTNGFHANTITASAASDGQCRSTIRHTRYAHPRYEAAARSL